MCFYLQKLRKENVDEADGGLDDLQRVDWVSVMHINTCIMGR